MTKRFRRRGVLRPRLKRFAPAYLLGLLTLFIVDYVNLFIPQYMGEVTDGLADHTLDAQGVGAICLKIVVCGLVMFAGRFLWRYFIFGSARKIELSIRNQMFAHLEGLPQRYFHSHKTGDLMSYFTNDLEALRMAIGPAVVSCFDSTVLTVLVLIRMITRVNLRLTLYTLIPMGILAVLSYFLFDLIDKLYAKMQKAFADLSDYVQESISGERVVKAFVQERAQGEAFRVVNEKKRRATMDVVKLDSTFEPGLSFLVGITYVIAIVVGGWYAMTGEISLGDFVAFNLYIGSLVWPMIAFGDAITLIAQGVAGLDRLHEILDEESDILDDPDPDEVESLTGEISLQDVSFAYEPGLPEKLSHLSVEVKAGETLAVMGRTGSGKSTLVDLLCRVYDVTGGSITFDGHDIRKIPLHILRENIAYVPQDNFLFSNTLAGNISFGRLDATQKEIEEAAKAADIHDNIMDFPEGYQTVVGERGVTLSGGQKQRSSIARALLKDSPILILDDALSAVDTDTEETILKNLKEVRRGKTTILIAHRVSTVQNADNVLILADGVMVEYGPHDALVQKEGGVFAEMVRKQQLEKQLELED